MLWWRRISHDFCYLRLSNQFPNIKKWTILKSFKMLLEIPFYNYNNLRWTQKATKNNPPFLHFLIYSFTKVFLEIVRKQARIFKKMSEEKSSAEITRSEAVICFPWRWKHVIRRLCVLSHSLVCFCGFFFLVIMEVIKVEFLLLLQRI